MAIDENLQSRLDSEYASLTAIVSEYDGRLVTIKSWSVTVSLASLGLAFQERHAAFFGLAVISGLGFWSIEALVKRHQVRYYPRMRQIEAWSVRATDTLADGETVSAPRIDWAWAAAGSTDPAETLRQPPIELTSVQIRRLRSHTMWLPHVLLPSAIAATVGALLSLLAAVGVIKMPL